jgi:prevent-host-death family protein
MTRLNASKLREDLSDTLNRVAYQGERVVLDRHGKSVAAIVSMEDLRLLQELEDRIDSKSASRARREVKTKGAKPWSKVKENLKI